jgi:PAS domain S-box-containing protein
MDPLLTAALDAVISIDEHGNVIELNPAAERTFGYGRAEALGRPMAELIVPQRLRDAHRAGFARVLAGGPSEILGHRVGLTALRADGEEFPVELTVTRTAEEPAQFTAWIRDLSARRAIEAQSARRKTMLERAEELAQIGSWEWDPATDQILWSDNLFRLFGLEPGEVKPTLGRLRSSVHPDDRGRLERTIELGRREGTIPALRLRIVRRDGGVRRVEVRAGGGKQRAVPARDIVGTVQDVTDNWWAERELAAHLAVLESFSTWRSLNAGAAHLLGGLGAALEFAVGTLWVPAGDLLRARSFWSAPWVAGADFDRAGRRRGLPRGIALPGRAWERREPVQVASLLTDDSDVRRQEATRAGLGAGVAVPALAGAEVLAIVELWSGDAGELPQSLVQSLTEVGDALGTFLARRRGHLNPSRLTPRELEVLQLAAHGHSTREIAAELVISSSTVKTHFEHIYPKLEASDRAAAVAAALRQGLIE